MLDWSRAQVVTMRSDPHARAIRSVVHDLPATRDGTTYVFERTSGTSVRYDLGSEEPLIGHNAPEFVPANGTGLADLLRNGHGVALDFTGGLREVAQRYDDRIRHVTGPARDDLGFGAVLVRPDGIVAWAGGREPDRDAFEESVRRWFFSVQAE